METVAVLGVGLLGTGFVENLLGRGLTVRVWNRTASKLAPLVARGAVAAASPADAVAGASRVHLILAEDAAVDAVVDALRPGLADGVPIFDHSTNLPALVAARFARLRAAGVRYLPCPVFMAPSNARGATGLMLVAGPDEDAALYTPVLSTMTGTVWHVGERPDLAAIYKLMGNQMLISLSGVMGDALALADAKGLPGDAVADLLAHFNPGAMLPSIAARVQRSDAVNASFTLEMARKDVRLMLESAGPGLNVLPAVAERMDQAIAEGKGGKDYAIFAKR